MCFPIFQVQEKNREPDYHVQMWIRSSEPVLIRRLFAEPLHTKAVYLHFDSPLLGSFMSSENTPLIALKPQKPSPLPKFQLFILLWVQLAEPLTSQVIYPFINKVNLAEKFPFLYSHTVACWRAANHGRGRGEDRLLCRTHCKYIDFPHQVPVSLIIIPSGISIFRDRGIHGAPVE